MPFSKGLDMHTPKKGIGVGLPPEQIAEIDQFASGRNISRSEAIRSAVAVGLPMLKMGAAVNTGRILVILEHTQLVLSMLCERQYPDDAAEILQMALDNADTHHG